MPRTVTLYVHEVEEELSAEDVAKQAAALLERPVTHLPPKEKVGG